LIRSSWAGPTNDVEKTLSGTSMAAPFVSGAVALYLEREPSALPHTLRYYLLSDAQIGVLSSPQNSSNLLDLLFNPTPNILLNVQGLFVRQSLSSAPSPGPTNALRDFSDATMMNAPTPTMGSIYNQAQQESTKQQQITDSSGATKISLLYGMTTMLMLIFHFGILVAGQ
jgi:subtilisin family serine protease